ncbi:MAG: hypothetical protein OXR62_11605 [Ahrensia sp.]|nr:hypothetical protein [Ahrensia sp.]
MIIEVTSSGGIGGIAAAGINKRVVTQSANAAMRDALCEAFDPKRLRKIEGAHPGAADQFSYRIRVTQDNGDTRTFQLPETALPAEMLDLIDAM